MVNYILWAELFWTTEYMTELVCTEITDHGRSLIVSEGKKFQGQQHFIKTCCVDYGKHQKVVGSL